MPATRILAKRIGVVPQKAVCKNASLKENCLRELCALCERLSGNQADMSILLKTLMLAVVQGITEFLPVSSSGHLLLMKHLMGIQSPGLLLVVALHLGTLISVLVYYRKRLKTILFHLVTRGSEGQRYAAALVLGSIPVFFLGLFYGHSIENLAANPRVTAGLLVVNGLILLSLLIPQKSGVTINPVNALIIGIAQAIGAFPGISRSGSTIIAARHIGISPKDAAEFSFLLYIPAVVGSVAYTCLDEVESGLGDLTATAMLMGIVVSAIVGYVAILCLIKILSAGKFWLFGIYCAIVGTIALAML